MKPVLSDHAVDQLRNIAEYLSQQNKQAAAKFVDDIFKLIDSLPGMPELGSVLQGYKLDGYREIIFKRHKNNYRIVYKLKDGIIFVSSIKHTRQLRDDPDDLE